MSQLRLRRPTWLEIDVDAVVENLRATRRLIGAARKLFAVIKGDGYGFGALEMAEAFVANGADALAVADLGDAVRLRRHGVTHPILMYPNALPEAADEALAFGVTPTLIDEESAVAYARAAAKPFAAFVKIDVGLERLGVPAERAVEFIRRIHTLPHLGLEGIYTHLHVPPAVDPAYVDWQRARFTRVLEALDAEGIAIPVRLVASSHAVLGFPATYMNAVDPGRMLYGALAPGVASPVPLRPALRALKTRLISVREVTPRDRFAADAPFPLGAVTRLGVIPAGWGDGLATLSAGRVLVRGRSCAIVARPSFEHTRVDLSGVPGARVGDEVVLLGRQGEEEISLAEVARLHDLDPIQLAPAVREGVTRVYLSGGQVAKVRAR